MTLALEQYINDHELDGKSRLRDKVYKRFYLYYLLRKRGLSLTYIGSLFNRKHETVIHGLIQYDNLKDYEDFKEYISDIDERLLSSDYDILTSNSLDMLKMLSNFNPNK